MTIKYP